MKLARSYNMTRRADDAQETGDRILAAAIDLFWESPSADISLDDVAQRAGVSVRTVIRRFGGRDGLMRASAERQVHEIAAERHAPVGDVDAAVAALVAHYERIGDGVLRLLAAAPNQPALADIADEGRRFHHDWCRTVFAPALRPLAPADRRRRLAQFIAVCDVGTWRLLRRDGGLSRTQTERALRELLNPLVEA